MAIAAEPKTDIDQLCINTIRTLSIDAVQKANSGHPGTPMAMAPVAYTLWQRFLRFDPADPIWPNRDRFVLSAGHASMLLYSLLHLAGVKAVDPEYEVVGEPAVRLDDIKHFRQLDSKCPGHPEYRWTSGVETTTGPLGQGVATSVGMAIAAKWLAARYNRPGFELFDFDIYAIAGDGCLMEGVSNEAASLAGHLQLSTTSAGSTTTTTSRSTAAPSSPTRTTSRRASWATAGTSPASATPTTPSCSTRAFEAFRDERGPADADHRRQPYRLRVAAQAGHRRGPRRAARRGGGAGDQARLRLARGRAVPGSRGRSRALRRGDRQAGAELSGAWKKLVAANAKQEPALAAELDRIQRRELPDGWDADIPSFAADMEKGMATRKASNKVENAIAPRLPWLIAGSADLTGSTSVGLEGVDQLEPESYGGRQLHLGIREHESAAISNGLSLSKLRPLWSTYLTFSDYARPAIRLSALMELPVIHLFTHDSIGLGEDGPTHQPVEQLASLRAIPGPRRDSPGRRQ